MINDTKMPVDGGVGKPMMYLPGLVGPPLGLELSTLKRANRTAAQATNMKAVKMPGSGARYSTHLYTSSEGATPNETMSASESSCKPKALWVRVMRASRPSIKSKNMAKIS